MGQPRAVADDAEAIGRDRLHPPYAAFVSTGAARATLVIGHSPANEAAVLGLAGQVIPPLGKGEGVLLTEDGGHYQAERLD